MDDPSRWIAKRGADHSPRGASSFRRLKSLAGRFTAEYGMIFVLLLLCALFSILTVSDQSPDGGTGAAQVAEEIEAQLGKSPRVLIVAGDLPDDAGFVPALVRQLKASGAQVLGEAQGKPQNAREALQKIAASGVKLDAIACTLSSGTWLVVTDAAKDFPQIGEPRIVTPRTYRWPTFLNVANLLNIANQIAIIAIIAIGMTMVIITGGIDLSVGSLLALSAVLAARFIRDFAGGVNASFGGMLLACIAAIVLCGIVGAFSGAMITRFAIPPFIVTLAMMLVGSGLAYILAKGQSGYQIPDSFVWLGRGADLMSLPNAVVLMLILYALAHVLMSRMKLGRYIYAVGGNGEAARQLEQSAFTRLRLFKQMSLSTKRDGTIRNNACLLYGRMPSPRLTLQIMYLVDVRRSHCSSAVIVETSSSIGIPIWFPTIIWSMISRCALPLTFWASTFIW